MIYFKKYILLLLFVPSLVFAGRWSEPLNVVNVEHFASQEYRSAGGYSLLKAVFNKDIADTENCKASNSAVYPGDNNRPDVWTQPWLAILLSSQAQSKQVQIYIVGCFADAVLFNGVRVLGN
ncbi:hypothetical protein M3P05_12525 [Sansalvadorimonas sp. 2012CJ34-2]|uniref:Uncharacterized protein n=1 Tax=Parendozoicomonas callyspongiae TaxID=2942213 RepID=A0ABT0PHA8_9GAMM|nr:hypothetical protein [Sansalvadorimonas sp. 2012CJ34-2]MCL6270749.1 hypothetical protein [Sansalvadorimonas sp. 2012CJ34-2]